MVLRYDIEKYISCLEALAGHEKNVLLDHKKTLSIYEKILEIRTSFYPPNHQSICVTLMILPYAYRYFKQMESAIECFGKSFEAVKAFMASKANDLKDKETYDFLKRYLVKYERYIEIYRMMQVEYNPDSVDPLDNLDKANSAFKIELKLLPENKEIFVGVANNLAKAHMINEDYRSAKETYRKLLKFRENNFPNGQKEISEVLKNLGNAHLMEENFDKAIECYKKCLKIGENDPEFALVRASCLKYLGFAYELEADYDKAYFCFDRAKALLNQE